MNSVFNQSVAEIFARDSWGKAAPYCSFFKAFKSPVLRSVRTG